MKTRCPHCKAMFEVSNDELTQAVGAVRCGKCLKIFNAINHRTNKLENADLFLSADSELDMKAASIRLESDTGFGKGKIKSKNKKVRDSKKYKKATKSLLKYVALTFAAVLVLGIVVVSAKMFLQHGEVKNFEIENIRILPGDNLQEFKVEFELQNLQNQNAQVPVLSIQMQDLSQNTIEERKVLANEIQADLKPLKTLEKRQFRLVLKRPKILVAGVKIYIAEEKLRP